jgi:pimeloyl-ACP methyl ester carboxylesterase
MKRLGRIIMGVGAGATAILLAPLLVPVKPLEGVAAPEELADADSHFVEVNGVKVHLKLRQPARGAADRPAIILLHGFSSGAWTWRKVMDPLAELGTVVAYDRPSSGLTERPLPGEWMGPSPYTREAQVDLLIELMDSLGIRTAFLVGNSAGGTIALMAAALHPERVAGLVLVDAAIHLNGGAPEWIVPLLRTPQMERLGPLLARNFARLGPRLLDASWHDPAKITADDISVYTAVIRVQDWDHGLWEMTKAYTRADLAPLVEQVRVPTLIITGDDDRIIPAAQSLRLADELPHAELVVIPECGHTPQEECPEQFLDAVKSFIERVS